MDVNTKNHVFVAKNCGRTATLAAEVIDGDTLPIGSVQIQTPLVDSGAAALSYYGGGELLITDESGRFLNTTLAVKTVPDIVIHQRSLNGANHFFSNPIAGKDITSYTLIPYKAPSENVAIISGIDASLADTAYMLKIRTLGSQTKGMKINTVKTAYFKTAVAGNTAAEIATGLVAYINTNFVDDPVMPMTAAVTGAASNEVTITALPLTYEVGQFVYDKLKFSVQLVNFTATVQYNDAADLTVNAVTHTQSTKGAGTYMQVAEAEWFAKMYTGANKTKVHPSYSTTELPLDVQVYEDDGTTANRYDTLVINYTSIDGSYSQNIRHQGSITLYLPVDDNATNQVGVALIGIMAVLDKYIVTEYGIGSVQIGNIT